MLDFLVLGHELIAVLYLVFIYTHFDLFSNFYIFNNTLPGFMYSIWIYKLSMTPLFSCGPFLMSQSVFHL